MPPKYLQGRLLSEEGTEYEMGADKEQHITRRALISFNANSVDPKHGDWLKTVEDRTGLGELDPQSDWGFDDLDHEAGTTLLNRFYVQADVKREGGREFFLPMLYETTTEIK